MNIQKNRVSRIRIPRVFSVLFLLMFCFCPTGPADAQQLSEEMISIFNEMLPQLDGKLQQKVRNAMDQDHDYLELTPAEFKRFRDHPANPFEGWDGIDPDSIKGLIRLQFEAQPIRSRVPTNAERQSQSLLDSNTALVTRSNNGTVTVTNGTLPIVLGTVVTAEGHVVTKLSEVINQEKLFCKSGDRKWAVEVVARNQANDLALLKIPDGAVRPVVFAKVQPEIGSFIFSTDGQGAPMAFGVYSNPPRSLIGKNQAFLGVKPVDDKDGIKIVEVTDGSSADDIGMLLGDVIVAINGNRLRNVQGLVNEIRKNRPGDRVMIEFLRDGQSKEATATLAGRNVGGPQADRFPQMNTFGAIQSERRDEFPLVFQHDTPLVPEQCGGPVTNLEGEVVGINIARGGRVASYAVPSGHVKQLVMEMLRPNVASADTNDR